MVKVRYKDEVTGRLNIQCLDCKSLVSRGAMRCHRCAINYRHTFHPGKGRKRNMDWVARVSGENSVNWRGGRSLDKYGYVKVLLPGHPNAQVTGYVLEHRLVMSRKLGRPLEKGETVHHKNGNKSDNRVENLMLCSTWKEHMDNETPLYYEKRRQNILKANARWRVVGKIHIPKETIEKLYYEDKLSLIEVARKLNVSKPLIWKKMSEYGIKRRSTREGKILSLQKVVVL